jgi:hypothetical protein
MAKMSRIYFFRELYSDLLDDNSRSGQWIGGDADHKGENRPFTVPRPFLTHCCSAVPSNLPIFSWLCHTLTSQ